LHLKSNKLLRTNKNPRHFFVSGIFSLKRGFLDSLFICF
jgi:hypothetical protein